MPKSFEQWLAWIETCHPVEIDLGLERASKVLKELLSSEINIPIITVAGTNGKGSTVAVLEALAKQFGLKPLVFTSPHFLDYRERLTFNGAWLSKQQHVTAFEAVESARGSAQLTYFEYSTLAAFKCVELLNPDILILETGLGGRLDAVNLVAADIAIITTVDYDHQDWLGDDLESIAREKAGIVHPNKVAVIGDPEFPQSILEEIKRRTDKVHCAHREFQHSAEANQWRWSNSEYGPWLFEFPSFPFSNASVAIQAWSLLTEVADLSHHNISQALATIELTGRYQTVATDPTVILDVAHNPQAFRRLAKRLNNQSFSGETYLILGMLEDKNATACIESLMTVTDHWFLCDLETSRGRTSNNLKQLLKHSELDENRLKCHSSPIEAYRAASARASNNDRIIVTGSFYTVAPILELYYKTSKPVRKK